MDLTIRKGESKDLQALLGLIKDLAEFERSPESVANTLERMTKEQAHFSFFVADADGQIVASVVYFFAYFTWIGKSLYLDDLYVKPEYRGQGVGTKLLRKIFEVAKEENCYRVRWQVLDWNTHAIELYKKLGAAVSGEWLNCDFSKEGIDEFLQKS